ncbi:hypothetical protein FOA52_015704 [Chlamydomonas sp. UWO 241]|nr:hypothetical protein FOA52_015704 [Chlamydomonas sp. UWO 241]
MQGARVWQSPLKYLQHGGLIKDAGRMVQQTFPRAQRASLIISKRARGSAEGKLLIDSFRDPLVIEYEGECSREGVNLVTEMCRANGVDHVVAFGGGKLIDVGKLVANEINGYSVVIPSVASTDAPCTALSVLYTPTGEFDEYVFFSKGPDVVLVDSEVLLASPLRFTVCGMGDAMSTYYEARAVSNNPEAANLISPFCFRPTSAVLAVSRQCRDTLFTDSADAIKSIKSGEMSNAFENIVEAGILMSGLGAESGGLAAAHAIHNGLAELPETHKMYHGEKVAFGTLCHLMLEGDDTEARRVFEYNKMVGLPTCFADLGVLITPEKLKVVANKTMAEGSSIYNMRAGLTEEDIIECMMKADGLPAAAAAARSVLAAAAKADLAAKAKAAAAKSADAVPAKSADAVPAV